MVVVVVLTNVLLLLITQAKLIVVSCSCYFSFWYDILIRWFRIALLFVGRWPYWYVPRTVLKVTMVVSHRILLWPSSLHRVRDYRQRVAISISIEHWPLIRSGVIISITIMLRLMIFLSTKYKTRLWIWQSIGFGSKPIRPILVVHKTFHSTAIMFTIS